jgi:hypothetical protein
MTAADALRQLLAVVEAALVAIHEGNFTMMDVLVLLAKVGRLARDGLAGEGGPLNQCDGCRAGHPLRNGTHVPEGSLPWDGQRMVCTADRYRPEKGREG